ncbi:EP300-interacting inhibitor of differentiation 2B [Carlito syrichta]|uniref:EP300-interacting inhibitor of differentiation 2B n=1 Tax=Carlito syrichta TaxID=1868482 RepID=A0A1U7TWU8_CARSF|nr:EP300-interacting inhibitor of differentiation 2B [Carlito syrichta]
MTLKAAGGRSGTADRAHACARLSHGQRLTRACVRAACRPAAPYSSCWGEAPALDERALPFQMSELPGESRVAEGGTASGVSDVLQAAVGGGSRAQEPREGPMAEAARPMARVRGAAHGPVPDSAPGPASVPDPHRQLGFLGIHQQLLFREYLDTCPMIPARLLRDIEERRRLFVEGCKAREAAFDANPPQMDFDAVAFALALTASEATSPLAD